MKSSEFVNANVKSLNHSSNIELEILSTPFHESVARAGCSRIMALMSVKYLGDLNVAQIVASPPKGSG